MSTEADKQVPITLIFAAAKNGVIGQGGDMPWRMPSDLKQFKARTMRRPLVMGRKTFESLPGILPGRPHIIVSRQDRSNENSDSVTWVKYIDQALAVAQDLIKKESLNAEIMIIGGSEIFKLTENLAACAHISQIDAHINGDTFFTLDMALWKLQSCTQIQHYSGDSHPYQVCQYSKL